MTSLNFARPVLAATRAGIVTSQGDLAMRSDVARTTFGVDGTGVKVGVLSDSFDCLGGAGGDVMGGDLSPVNVLQELPGCASATDEGRAMLQIVHDVAPGASLLFATAFTGQAGFAANILNLASAGADVIVDDVIYFAEPMFQDGIIAQAVDIVVASGVSYFSAAGNVARAAYQAGFVDSGINLGSTGLNRIPTTPTFIAHDFDPGPGVDTSRPSPSRAATTLPLVFSGLDPFFSVSGGARRPDRPRHRGLRHRRATSSSDASAENVGADPVEILAVTNSGAAGAGPAPIGKFAGPSPSAQVHVHVAQRSTFVVNEFATNSGSLYGHANAVGAEAVGAAAVLRHTRLRRQPAAAGDRSRREARRRSSSRSAERPTFEPAAEKPEIVAPDGAQHDVLRRRQRAGIADTFPNFFGTSAAAPHAAAVAALLLHAVPS